MLPFVSLLNLDTQFFLSVVIFRSNVGFVLFVVLKIIYLTVLYCYIGYTPLSPEVNQEKKISYVKCWNFFFMWHHDFKMVKD